MVNKKAANLIALAFLLGGFVLLILNHKTSSTIAVIIGAVIYLIIQKLNPQFS